MNSKKSAQRKLVFLLFFVVTRFLDVGLVLRTVSLVALLAL